MKKPVALLINVLISFPFAVATDIPMFRGNPQHTGVVADSPTPKGGVFLNSKWRFQTGGRIRTTSTRFSEVYPPSMGPAFRGSLPRQLADR